MVEPHCRTAARRLPATVLLAALTALAGGCGRQDAEESASRSADGGDALIDPASIAGTEMTEQAARALFPALGRPKTRVHWDPQAWVVLAPDEDTVFDWPEHPAGQIHFRTNNFALREDRPTTAEHDTYRILVLGDSHTEGAVDNSESFAHVLERRLNEWNAQRRAKFPATPSYEVLNAGVGGTGPDNYLGMLHKQLVLKPNRCIAVLYSGNDFMNALQIADFRSKRDSKPRDGIYGDSLKAAKKRFPDTLPQGFNQAFYFRYRPDDAQLALDAAVAAFEQMNAVCREHGIQFCAAVLPTKPDVDGEDGADIRDALFASLPITPDEFAVNARLAERFTQAMRDRDIPCLDALTPMRKQVEQSHQPLYWRRDHHLNVAGHALLGNELYQMLIENF